MTSPDPPRSSNQAKHESRNPIQRALIARFHRAVVEQTRAAQPASILDVGCGEGYTLDALVASGVSATLTGIDRSPVAIEHARRTLPSAVTLASTDADALVAEGRSFDLVMMLEVLEHIPDPGRMLPVLEALTRRWLLLSVPHEPWFCALNLARAKNVRRLGSDPDHINHWTRAGFVAFVSARFEVHATPRVFPWTMVLARRRERT